MAQLSGQGSISGTVTDSTDAVIPNAEVVATNVATGVKTPRRSTETGYFVISPLQPGTYTVTVNAKGFQKLVQENVTVNALQVVGLPIKLTVGSQAETVIVTEAPPLLQTADATLGAVMENETYSELPLSMSTQQRDPTNFVYLMPGVTSGGRSGAFNGAEGNMNEMYIEGVPLTTVDSQGDNRKINQAVSVDAVNQFQVQTNGSPATYQGAGVENFSIKSGTNKFHGGVNDFVRNTALDSWGFFQKIATQVNAQGQTVKAPKPPEHQNELSVSLSGPIMKNKVFFFVNYDKYHYTAKASPGLTSVPQVYVRSGDFTAYDYPIYDPKTLASCTAGNKGVACAKQFQGLKNGVPTNNVIPDSRISTLAKYMQSFLPTNLVNSNLNTNYYYPYLKGNDNWEFTGKVDINIGSRQQIALVSTSGVRKFLGLDMGSTSVLPLPYTNGTIVTEPTTTGIVKHTFVVSPTMINQVKFGYTRYWAPVKNATVGNDKYAAASGVGIGNLPAGQASEAFPAVTFSGGDHAPTSWSSPNGNDEAANSFTLGDDLQWSYKRHSFTFGFVTQWLQFNQSVSKDGSKPLGLTFKNNATSGYDSKGTLLNNKTGNSYASFLLGAVDSVSIYQANFSMLGSRFRTFSPYIQDDYKFNDRLTINMGLRWDYYSPYKEVKDRWSFFNPNLINPATGTAGALQFAGKGADACNCRTPVNTYMRNIGPRFGFAYRVTDKTVVRASAGIMYTHSGGVGGSSAGNYNGTGQTGLTVSPSITSTGQGGIPAFYLSQAESNTTIPAYSTTPVRSPSTNAGNYLDASNNVITAGSIAYADPYLGGRAPYTGQWSFSIQQQLTSNTTATINYTASSNHFLVQQGRGKWQNQLDPKYAILGAILKQTPSAVDKATGKTYLQEAQAIMPGIGMPYSNFGGSNGTISQMLKPFPQYSGITDTWGEIGNSSYNALQVIISRKETRDLSYTMNFSWNKTVDNMGSFRAGYAIPGNVIDGGKTWNVPLRIDRGDSGDAPLTFSFYGVYGLPFGPGHIQSRSRIVNGLVRQWKVSWIAKANRGGLLSISGAPIASYNGMPASQVTTDTTGCNLPSVGTCYPSYNPNFTGKVRVGGNYGHGVNASNASTQQFLNPNAFTSPGNGGYNIGNMQRSGAFGLRNVDGYNIDASVKRTFDLIKALKFTFQADVFNLDNHTQLGSLGTSLGSAAFGTFTKQGNSPRDWQFSGKLAF